MMLVAPAYLLTPSLHALQTSYPIFLNDTGMLPPSVFIFNNALGSHVNVISLLKK